MKFAKEIPPSLAKFSSLSSFVVVRVPETRWGFNDRVRLFIINRHRRRRSRSAYIPNTAIHRRFRIRNDGNVPKSPPPSITHPRHIFVVAVVVIITRRRYVARHYRKVDACFVGSVGGVFTSDTEHDANPKLGIYVFVPAFARVSKSLTPTLRRTVVLAPRQSRMMATVGKFMILAIVLTQP